ncbi:hypothetical protein H7X46_02625 [Pseudonocardia sp. C8]|uniref:PfkB family carbohydrate kinase n=1 Tax=Pseudonocardia sp. C8 TaxID=2762759 RepID=UPI0016436710|nr:PfkB family carbohydrate kinase [Pseudonocardia sp. C8]MBC3189957.1 hypothetical protein [Pseudonocardia sp. C8]
MWINAFGDCCVDRYRDIGRQFPGGGSLNVALHLARLGATTRWIGRLGNDDNAEIVARAFVEPRLDTSRVQRVNGETTVVDVDLVDGERTFTGWVEGVGLGVELTDEDLRFLFADADLVHTAWSAEFSTQPVPWCSGGAGLSVDFVKDQFADARPVLETVPVTVATFSRTSEDQPKLDRLIADVHSLGVPWVLVGMGESGAVVSHRGARCFQPAESIEVVDTLGAGDSFIAAALTEIVKGSEPPTVARVASQYAARTCLSYGGGAEGLPLTDVNEPRPTER